MSRGTGNGPSFLCPVPVPSWSAKIIRNWKRADYLLHRWLSIAIGLVVLSWFVSGFVMMYYPWPALTESARLEFDAPFEPSARIIGVERAAGVARHALRMPAATELSRIRLASIGPKLVYSIWGERVLLGGTLSAATGVWLAWQRVRPRSRF